MWRSASGIDVELPIPICPSSSMVIRTIGVDPVPGSFMVVAKSNAIPPWFDKI